MKLNHSLLLLCVIFTQGCQAQEISSPQNDRREDIAQISSSSPIFMIELAAPTPQDLLPQHPTLLLSNVACHNNIPLNLQRENTSDQVVYQSLQTQHVVTFSYPSMRQQRQAFSSYVDSSPSLILAKPQIPHGRFAQPPPLFDQFYWTLQGRRPEDSGDRNLIYLDTSPRRKSGYTSYQDSGYKEVSSDHSGGWSDLLLAITVMLIVIPLTVFYVVNLLKGMKALALMAWNAAKQLASELIDSCLMILFAYGAIFVCIVLICTCIILAPVALLIALTQVIYEHLNERHKQWCQDRNEKKKAQRLETQARIAEATLRIKQAENAQRLVEAETDLKIKRIGRIDSMERAETFTELSTQRAAQQLLAEELSGDLIKLQARENQHQADLLDSQRKLAEAAAMSVEQRRASQDLNEGGINLNNSLGG